MQTECRSTLHVLLVLLHAEAESIPKFMYDYSLEPPLGPRAVKFGATANVTITMHLHIFRLSNSSDTAEAGASGAVNVAPHAQRQQQQQVVGAKRPLTAVAAAAQTVLKHLTQPAASPGPPDHRSNSGCAADLLNLAVGARCQVTVV